MLGNTPTRNGLITLLIHWVSAFTIIGLFVLGVWMVDLDYYSEWYKTGPDIHRSVGVLLCILLLLRIALRFINPLPGPEPGLKLWEHRAALFMHWTLLLLILLVSISGYLITTADGSSIEVFNWFALPATVTAIENQEDVAGEIHYIFAVLLLVLAAFHALAALKHHFWDKDATLKKMLWVHK